DFGNLLNRTLGMVHKYGLQAQSAASDPFDLEAHKQNFVQLMETFQPSRALDEIWALVRRGNGYIDEQAPWKPTSPRAEILGNVLELLRVLSHLLEPFLPERSLALRAQLGVDEKTAWPTWSARTFSPQVGTPLFPRVEPDQKKELLDRWRASHVAKAAVAAPNAATHTATKDSPAPATLAASADGRITFDQFGQVDLRVGKVLTAEAVPKAKKLLRLTLDDGSGTPRQIVAGIAEAYAPETLIGKSVIFVANLQPATIRGVESHGMILAAGDDKIFGLSALDREIPPGTKVR
ncbi:MAG TPA: methionine--tRNA ligase subunit beta, partial [Polyangia bacterium]|nr:methionine--tRNA ligase subunit beta [Polyangia bacterium]